MRENEALDFYSLEVWLFERLWDFQNNHKEKKGKANEIVDFFCRAIFSVEYQKWSWIAFVLLTTLCGWPEKIRSTISNNQMWHENQLAFSPRISQVARVRTCVVIGSCDTSVLVFTTLIWKLALDEMINQNRQNSNTCY